MKRFFELTEDEKLALTSEQIYDSVKIEGIHRGIKPPITLDAAISQVGYVGFSIPPDATRFYELTSRENSYGGASNTGICYRTQEEAEKALVGAIFIKDADYTTKQRKIADASLGVQAVWITRGQQVSLFTKLEELKQDNSEFEKLAEECRDDISRIRQARYNARVGGEKRKQYMDLAQGNEEIARAFWAKTEGTEFPE